VWSSRWGKFPAGIREVRSKTLPRSKGRVSAPMQFERFYGDEPTGPFLLAADRKRIFQRLPAHRTSSRKPYRAACASMFPNPLNTLPDQRTL
jgi:hypothetical protein